MFGCKVEQYLKISVFVIASADLTSSKVIVVTMERNLHGTSTAHSEQWNTLELKKTMSVEKNDNI